MASERSKRTRNNSTPRRQARTRPPVAVSLDESSVESGRSGGSSSTRTREKLPYWHEKALLSIFEEVGIDNIGPSKTISLTNLFNQPTSLEGIVGQPQSTLRLRVSRKFQKYKQLNREKYFQRLAFHQVKPWLPNASKPRNQKDDSSDSDGSSFSEFELQKHSEDILPPKTPQQVPPQISFEQRLASPKLELLNTSIQEDNHYRQPSPRTMNSDDGAVIPPGTHSE